MQLPTQQELYEAMVEFWAEGPNPMSQIIDDNPGFKEGLKNILRDAPDWYTSMKAAFVWGINLGIRIGEARTRGTSNASPEAN